MKKIILKRLIPLLHAFIAALSCITPLYGMYSKTYDAYSKLTLWEPLNVLTKNQNVHTLKTTQPLEKSLDTQILHQMRASKAHAYNMGRPLFSIIPTFCSHIDVLNQIFLHCTPGDTNETNTVENNSQTQASSLKNTIKIAMRLSTTCKSLNTLLTFKKIAEICSYYDPVDKDEVLQGIVKSMHAHTYSTTRLPALIMIHASIKHTPIKTHYCEDNLLENAVLNNDKQMIQTLLERGADSNAKSNLGQLFCYAGTVKIAKLFFLHHADIHANISSIHPTYGPYYPNVLWEVVHQKYPSALMHFYITHGVSVKKRLKHLNRSFKGGNCLLHELANPASLHIDNIDNFLRKGHLLLQAIPLMINALNNDKKTPIDLAQESLDAASASTYTGTPRAFEALIQLFKEHGGIFTHNLSSQRKGHSRFFSA